MFKKDVAIAGKTNVKSSVQRKIRERILETYPLLEPHIDTLMHKSEKGQMESISIRLSDRSLPFYIIKYTPKDSDGEPIKGTSKIEPLFYETKDHLIPHLKLVHKYPDCFYRLRVDRGAIRFVLSGATLMAPGLTSEGGRLPSEDFEGEDERFGDVDLERGLVVVVEAEGKENACLVGALKVGTAKLREEKKGPAIEDGWHYVGDGLWKLPLD
ncbi:hypothetical protein EJ08DRAFT_633667 [Tothia fuscella]|uniref:Translation machinery-associated protein 20 n=1 Tax=Tothia fuscella TaxID=1048955 RepID=A0A9P4TYQ9_9PEZI|nr:hypothetical protein EJ08DRAFT_633667 [Tothia fuscella]